MDRVEGVVAANRNVVGALDLLRIHLQDPRGARRRFGAVDAVAMGHQSPFFNSVFALDPRASAVDVIAAFGWVESLGMAASVVVDAATVASLDAELRADGLAPAGEQVAVMSLPLEPVPAGLAATTGSRTDPPVVAGGIELADVWWAAIEAGESMRALFNARVIADPDVRIATASLAGEPCAGAMAIRTGDVVGVYAVWTAEKARRQGLGRAVTKAVIEAAIASWGSRMAVLHSTELGFPIYRSLGFEQVSSVVFYVRPSAPHAA